MCCVGVGRRFSLDDLSSLGVRQTLSVHKKGIMCSMCIKKYIMWQMAKLFFFLECKIKLGPTEGTNILTINIVLYMYVLFTLYM